MIFLQLMMPVSALQSMYPFARHFTDSSAVTTDRDLGSGDHGLPLHEPLMPTMSCRAPYVLPLCGTASSEGTIRYGEARHPGPIGDDMLTVGVSNPGGVRQKEELMLELGPGIWSLAETQLSATTFKTSSHVLRQEGRKMNREVRFHGGSPAPLRQGSTWAGKWTGVAVMSDVPTQTLDVVGPLNIGTVDVFFLPATGQMDFL